ncbi:MAG: histidinol dehydrogenase [Spirochaetes bacterium]|nr:histidinol dehydrogenase [Spirochaetota bacterium]MBU0954791.1 histidinol dehydrogenase [Spirochaetota bacterium]
MAERLALRRVAAAELLGATATDRRRGMATIAGTTQSKDSDSRQEQAAQEQAAFSAQVADICKAVAAGGDTVLRDFIKRFDIQAGEKLWYGPEDFVQALVELGPAERAVLERSAARIRAFAAMQLTSLQAGSCPVPGGQAGQEILPLESAGCYVPGGRYPLVSSALMTIIPARVSGVGQVTVACPQPGRLILAACALAGADRLLAAGGAHAIAALAYGTETVPACDIVVGPGNRWVAAAKQLVSSFVRIDALAGPSELLVLADDQADARLVAADLLAQAEHDPDARVMLAACSENFVLAVESELNRLAGGLASLLVIEKSLQSGLACVLPAGLELPAGGLCATAAAYASEPAPATAGTDQAAGSTIPPEYYALAAIANRMAPEHLSLAVSRPELLQPLCRHAGAVFSGGQSAEVFGDYAAGPNHTLPTGGQARLGGGLSVFDFLRIRTWLRLDENADGRELVTRSDTFLSLIDDALALARMEGLPAHGLSADLRGGRQHAQS